MGRILKLINFERVRRELHKILSRSKKFEALKRRIVRSASYSLADINIYHYTDYSKKGFQTKYIV